MKKPLDRISEAYFGELGDAFAEKVRSRIHWVCENAKGETILDVGCSQGITAILLGREGKKVLGIDLLHEAIDHANETLSKEEGITRDFVEFKADNFMTMDLTQTFDSIIFGEVLEHITDPKRFIQKAVGLLNPSGSIIVTLPFGINDYFDHKKTYYLMDLLDFQEDNIEIQEVKFFGKWIGAILKKQGEEVKSVDINLNLVKQLEDAFYSVEKELWVNIRNRGQKINVLEDKVKSLIQEKNNILQERNKANLSKPDELKEANSQIAILRNQILEKEAAVEEYKKLLNNKEVEITTLKAKVKSSLDELNKVKKQAATAKKEKVQVQEQLLNAYEKEETLLRTHQKLLNKYRALSESKLGKITLAYWRKRRHRVVGGK